MNEVLSRKKENTITSMELAEMVEQEHKNVLRKIDEIIKNLTELKIEPSNFYTNSTRKDPTGRTVRCYEVTRKGCEMFAHKLTSEKGILFTAKYIERFHDLEDANKQKIPTTYKEALQQLIVQVEENEKLLADNERMKPKEIFADAVSTSNTDILVGDLAKILKGNGVDIGQNKLFSWLREHGYLIKKTGESYNMPTQKAMELKLFRVKESTVMNPDGSVRVTKTTKVTGKGQQYFVNKFLTE